MTDRPLSPRHQRFVAEHLRDGNATQAYIRAGYSAHGAQSCASRLLAQPHIEAALSSGRQRIAETLQVTVERVAQEYAAIAFALVEVGLDHGKALQARRLKPQALAALTRSLPRLAADGGADTIAKHGKARAVRAEPAAHSQNTPQGLPPRDSPEFRDLLDKLRRGTLDFAMSMRMIEAGYGPSRSLGLT